LQKPKSYISAILHSGANLTLRVIVEIEEALGEQIITVKPTVSKN